MNFGRTVLKSFDEEVRDCHRRDEEYDRSDHDFSRLADYRSGQVLGRDGRKRQAGHCHVNKKAGEIADRFFRHDFQPVRYETGRYHSKDDSDFDEYSFHKFVLSSLEVIVMISGDTCQGVTISSLPSGDTCRAVNSVPYRAK